MQPGHTSGNLNFTATRNGWTRSFNFTPEELHKMDYGVLESVLELKTLKAARSNLRIYVENPVGSGSYMKLRPWKAQDGSLQTNLLHTFFEERLRAGTVTNLDVRDATDAVKQAIKTGDWLRAQVSGITVSHPKGSNDEGEAAEDARQGSQPTTPRSQSGFLNGFFRSAPSESENPSSEQGDLAESQAKEEEILRERGWQPIIRRLTSKKYRKKKSSQELDIQAEGDGEDVQTPDGEEPNTLPERNKSWRKPPFSISKQKAKETGLENEIPPPLPVKGSDSE